MFRSLCQPDIYVHLYYVVNVEAETKVLVYVNLIFMSTCIT